MQAYMYREGMVRLCTEDYARPTRENKNNAFMHLCNYSLNKMNEEAFSKDLIGGSKRKFSSLLEQIEEHEEGLTDDIWRSIDEVCTKTMNALQPFISNLAESYLEGSLDKVLKAELFHVIGFDIMLD